MNQTLAETCLRYLDGDLAGDELQAFNRLLIESADAADLLAQLALDEQHYRATPAEAEADSDALAALLEMEQQAESCDWPATILTGEARTQSEDAGSLSAHNLAAIGGYALRLALTSQAAKRIYAYAAVAAITLLAVALFSPWAGNEDVADAPIAANTTDKPAESADPILRDNPAAKPVATLTATYNAKWAEGAVAPGSQLRPGTRLTLNAGFAQITTNDGAVAILEAPATVELLDNRNALRLHTGKLVGICETESSKGFLVRTPHADITDLGTEFGVDIGQNTTVTTVFSGSVEFELASGQTQSLTANQTARLASVNEKVQLTTDDRVAEGFETILNSPMFDRHAALRPRFDSEQVLWVGTLPRDLRSQKQTSDRVQVFVEQRGRLLDKELAVDLSPEVREYGSNIPATSVPAGTKVDVYLLHLDTPGSDVIRRESEIRFDRPILGVIADGEMLIATDAVLGVEGVAYPDPADENHRQRGLDLNEKHGADRLSLDGKTLRLSFAAGLYMDQVRVLVQSAEQQPGHP